MKRILVTILCSLVMLCMAAPASALEPLGTPLPDVTLPDMDNNKHSIKELLKGKVGVLVWWSVTCPHCQREMPGLIKMHKTLVGNAYRMITLNTDSPEMIPAAKAMVRDFDLPQPALMDLGENDSMPMADYYDVVVTPTVVVVGTDGKVVYSVESESDLNELRKAIVEAF